VKENKKINNLFLFYSHNWLNPSMDGWIDPHFFLQLAMDDCHPTMLPTSPPLGFGNLEFPLKFLPYLFIYLFHFISFPQPHQHFYFYFYF
jgi:hypothetical protein